MEQAVVDRPDDRAVADEDWTETRSAPAEQARFGEVLRSREARTLLGAALASGLGDQVARIALAVLVLERSDSVLLTSCVYAVSYLPWVVGGPFLAALADRYPVRRVLVGSDVARAVTVGLMLVPGTPIWTLLLLLFLTELAAPPFDAGRSALLPEVLHGDAYVAGCALLSTVQQTCLFGGVAFGGALLVVVDPSTALALNAASFLLSAVLLHRGLQWRAAASTSHGSTLLADTATGLRAVFRTPRVRRLVLAVWIACAVVVLPEGLAIAYAVELEAAVWAVPALLAAEPLGAALGALAVARLVPPARRAALTWPLLIGGCLPLVAMLARPGLAVTAVLLFCCGTAGAAVVLASTEVGRTVEPQVRGRVFGIAASGLMAAQGLALLGGGVLAEVLPLHQVMALAGLLGLVALLPLALRDTRRVVIDLTAAQLRPAAV